MLRLLRLLAVLSVSVALLAQSQPQLVWEGELDGSATLYVRGKKLRLEERSGGLPVQREGYRFIEELPDYRQNVEVRVIEGRGEVRVLEQPTLENQYTLRVGIEDRQAGSSFYSLQFFWSAGTLFARDPFNRRKKPLPSSGTLAPRGLTWTGRVEGTVRVTVEGRETSAQSASGIPLRGATARFERDLPARESNRISLRKHRGRGRVDIIEYPSKKNGYRLIFEISDSGSGSDEYEVEVGW